MDPKAELSEKDRQKQEKREAQQEKKEKKREREAEKRAHKYPDKAPKVHKPKEVGSAFLDVLGSYSKLL